MTPAIRPMITTTIMISISENALRARTRRASSAAKRGGDLTDRIARLQNGKDCCQDDEQDDRREHEDDRLFSYELSQDGETEDEALECESSARRSHGAREAASGQKHHQHNHPPPRQEEVAGAFDHARGEWELLTLLDERLDDPGDDE